MTSTELAKGIRNGMFQDRDTVKEAYEYAYDLIDSMPKYERWKAFTALHVVLNTVARKFEKLDLKEM